MPSAVPLTLAILALIGFVAVLLAVPRAQKFSIAFVLLWLALYLLGVLA